MDQLPNESEVVVIRLVNMHIAETIDLELSIISNISLEEGPRNFNKPRPKVFSSKMTLHIIMIFYLIGSNS